MVKKCLLVVVALVGLLVAAISSAALAQAPDMFAGASGNTCGIKQTMFSSMVESLPSGKLYLKTNAARLKTDGAIYVEDIETGKCAAIGKANINDKTWTYIGNVSSKLGGKPANLVISSSYIGADAYASVATALIIPDDRCKLTKTGCLGTYAGNKGVIEPQTISVPGDFITVQTIPEISSEKIMYVEYYDGGDFLYAIKSIEDVQRQYLRGGDRSVKKVVYLTNNRLFTVTEKVSMPKDPLYSQYLKSTFYRLGSQTKVVLILIGSVVLLFLGITAIRRFHAWRTYRNGHGIETYLHTHHQ